MSSQPSDAQPQWGVMAQYRQPPSTQQAAPSQPTVYPAAQRSQVAVKEPWRMTPDEIAQYQAAGYSDDDIWGVHRPGRVA